MTDKIILSNIATFQNDTTAVNVINNNNALITTAFDNTLSLNGQSPNQMQSNLDMNSNQIINLPPPGTVNSPARLVDVVSNPTIVVPPTGTSGATVPFLNGNNTWSGTNTFNNTVTFNSPITIPNNTVTNSALAQAPAKTIKGNGTSSTANVTDLSAITLPFSGFMFASTGANVCRLDKLFVGEATNATGNRNDLSEWVDALVPNGDLVSAASIAGVAPQSRIGVIGASRAADDITDSNQSVIGVCGFVNNNGGTLGATGIYGEAWRNSAGSISVTATCELDTVNKFTTVDIDPYNFNLNGETNALRLASGGSRVPVNNDSAAITFVNNSAAFRKGLVFENLSLDTVGGTVNPDAIAFAGPHAISWYGAAATKNWTMFSAAGANSNLNINTIGTGSLVLGTNLKFNPTTNGVVGTLTNDSASTGIVGEFVNSTVLIGSAIALTSNTPVNLGSISLTAGDWDLYFISYFVPGATTNITSLQNSISTTSGTFDTSPGNFSSLTTPAGVPNGQTSIISGPRRLSIASTTTVFGVVNATFTVSTLSTYGIIRARRVR